jgi:hypothetical protein
MHGKTPESNEKLKKKKQQVATLQLAQSFLESVKIVRREFTGNSPRTDHCAQFTAHGSLRTIHRGQFTTNSSPRTIHRWHNYSQYNSPRKN